MASSNVKSRNSHVYDNNATRLADGFGAVPAKQDAEALLRRAVLSCLLWENNAYESGVSIVENIKGLIPLVSPEACSKLAIEARYTQKLRHVPLLIVREMARLSSHKHLVSHTLKTVINRPDEICEFLSLYWDSNDGKKTISKQVKLGLSEAFNKFDEYQLAKWNKKGKKVSLKDAMCLIHPKPHRDKELLFKKLMSDQLDTPYTWEVELSKGGDKKEIWTDLLTSGRLPTFALLKNIRNIEESGVSRRHVRTAFENANPGMMLPIDFIRAADNSTYTNYIEELMFKSLNNFKKLPGYSVFVLDVSGSMTAHLSCLTKYTRMDAGIAIAMLAVEMCEDCSVYLTAGSDYKREHLTAKIKPMRGFGLVESIKRAYRSMGGGGIFTAQCLEYIKAQETDIPDRIIVFSDSQDCDSRKIQPKPFGKKNYIVDVSSHKHGINYSGVWTAEISGWSENFLRYISEVE